VYSEYCPSEFEYMCSNQSRTPCIPSTSFIFKLNTSALNVVALPKWRSWRVKLPMKTRIHAYHAQGLSQMAIKRKLQHDHSAIVSQLLISRVINGKTKRKHRRAKPPGPKRRLTDRTARYIAYIYERAGETGAVPIGSYVKNTFL
jgi:hypothetical protein